jgi:flagellar biosynthetic protein FliR
MISIEPILPHLPAFVVVLARVAGILMMTPLLSAGSVPVQVKAVFAGVWTLALYPFLDVSRLTGATWELWDLLPLVVGEIFVGATIGLLAGIPLLSVQLAGLLMGQQMGLGLAQQIDPTSDIEGDNLGQMLFILAVTTFVVLGGLDSVFVALLNSFASVPPGAAGLGAPPIELLTALVASGFEMALRVALPVLTIILLESIAVGFLMKTVPSINIMSFGFPLRILIGVSVLIAALTPIAWVIGAEMEFALQTAHGWVESLGADSFFGEPVGGADAGAGSAAETGGRDG